MKIPFLALLVAASPAAALSPSHVREAEARVLGTTVFAAPANAVGAGLSVKQRQQVLQDLSEAVALRQDIRKFLFERGRRTTKELIAQAKGDMHGWGLFVFGMGGGIVNGHYSAQQYQDKLEGGEAFVITSPAPQMTSFIQQMSCPASDELAASFDGNRAKDTLDQLRPKLARFQKLMDGLEAPMLSPSISDRLHQKYDELLKWGQNSVVTVSWVTPAGYDFHPDRSRNWMCFTNVMESENMYLTWECGQGVSRLLDHGALYFYNEDLRVY